MSRTPAALACRAKRRTCNGGGTADDRDLRSRRGADRLEPALPLPRSCSTATRRRWSGSWPRSARPTGTSSLDAGRPFAEAVAELAARHPHERARIEAYHAALARDGGRPDRADRGGAGGARRRRRAPLGPDQLVGRNLRPGPPRSGLRLPRPVPRDLRLGRAAAWSSPSRRSSVTSLAEHRRAARASCLFIDDVAEERGRGRGVGMRGPPLHRRRERLRRELAALGLLRRRCERRCGAGSSAWPGPAARRAARWPVSSSGSPGRSLPQLAASSRWPGSAARRPSSATPTRFRTSRRPSEADAYLALGFLHGQDRLWQMEFDRLARPGPAGRGAGRGGAADRPLHAHAGPGPARRGRPAPASTPRRAPCSRPMPRASTPRSPATARRCRPSSCSCATAPSPGGRPTACCSKADGARPVAATGARSCCAPAWPQRLTPRPAGRSLARPPPPSAGHAGRRWPACRSTVWPRLLPEPPPPGDRLQCLGRRRQPDRERRCRCSPTTRICALQLPGHWYLAHLEAPGLAVIGATLPALPFVVLGRNRDIAWGFTNTGSDTQDLFVEQLDPADPGRYLTPDGSEPFTSHGRDDRRFAARAPVHLEVRETRHGPVISDLVPGASRRRRLGAGAGAGLDPAQAIVRTRPLEAGFALGQRARTGRASWPRPNSIAAPSRTWPSPTATARSA